MAGVGQLKSGFFEKWFQKVGFSLRVETVGFNKLGLVFSVSAEKLRFKSTARNHFPTKTINRPSSPVPPLRPLIAALRAAVIVKLHAANAGCKRGPEEETGDWAGK